MRFNISFSGVIAITPTGNGEYVGPLDVVSNAAVAYSQRAMSASFTDPVIQIENGSSTQDFAATTDHAVDSSAVSVFIGGGLPNISTIYDQSGNHIDLTPNDQPFTWAASVFGSKPGMVSSASETALGMSNIPYEAPAGAYTIFFTAYYDASAGYNTFVFDDQAESPQFYMGSGYNVAGDFYITIGRPDTDVATWVTSETLSGSGVHVFEMVLAADGAFTMFVDGNDMNAEVATGTAQAMLPNSLDIYLQGGAGNAVKYGDFVAWNIAMSSENRNTVRANMADWYGITL
jgi:hypothetical protein